MATRTFTSQIVLGDKATENLLKAIDKSTPAVETIGRFPAPKRADKESIRKFLTAKEND